MNSQNAQWFVSLSDESELEPSLVHDQPADDAEPPAIADSDLRLLCDPNFGLSVEPMVIAEGACGSEDVPLHGASPINCMLLGQAWEDNETVTDGLLSTVQNRVQVVNVETSTFLNCQETVSQSFQLERFSPVLHPLLSEFMAGDDGQYWWLLDSGAAATVMATASRHVYGACVQDAVLDRFRAANGSRVNIEGTSNITVWIGFEGNGEPVYKQASLKCLVGGISHNIISGIRGQDKQRPPATPMGQGKGNGKGKSQKKKPHLQEDESTKPLLKALAHLTLRVEQQVRQQMTQTCMVIAMQTGKDGLLPHLVDLATQWKDQKEKGLVTMALRQHLWKALCSQLQVRVDHVANLKEADPMYQQVRTSRLIGPCNGWTHFVWCPKERALKVDSSKPPMKMQTMVSTVQTLVDTASDPDLVQAFHAMGRMDEGSLSGNNMVSWKLHLSMRQDELWLMLCQIQTTAVWSLVGAKCHQWTQRPSNLVTQLQSALRALD